MGIHNFAIGTGHPQDDRFDAAWESQRSESQQRHTAIALHDDESADIKQARRMADEMINVCGGEVVVYVRTDNADYDAVWDEDPDPTYWNPINIKAYFKPQPLQAELAKWGVDTINRTEVVFSHLQIFQRLGKRMLRAGDVLQLPYNTTNGLTNFRIINATPSGNFRFIWLYLTCQVETLTADVTVRTQEDMPPMDDQIRTGGGYRESV